MFIKRLKSDPEPLPLTPTGVHGVRRLLLETEGASTIEYAVLLATVIACISIGVYCLGELSASTFDATANAIKANGPSTNEVATENEPQPVVSQKIIFLLGGAFVVGCGAPLVYVLFRLRKTARPEEKEPVDDSPPQEIPSEQDLAFAKRQELRRVFDKNMASLLNGQLKARHIMSRQVTCVRSATKCEAVKELFETKCINHVLVRNNDDRLVGIISQKDCMKRQGTKASDVMTANPFTIDSETDISVGITQLICRRVSCLPVLDQSERLIGVITATDFLLAFQCAIQTLGGVVNHISTTDSPRPKSAAKALSDHIDKSQVAVTTSA